MMNFEPLQYTDFPFLEPFQPPGWGDLVPRFKYAIDSSFCRPYKLVIENTMVAIGTVIYHKNTAWLASIITHPDHRKQGYGAAITKQLIDSIDRTKYETISLDATDMGYPVYTKLGFELEGTYAHFKAAENITGVEQDIHVVPFEERFRQRLFELDRFATDEDRTDTLAENITSSKLYMENGNVEGFYMPELGNGLIIALNAEAGIALMKCRINNNYYGILPSVNEAGKKFLEDCGLTQFRFSRRMLMGKKRNWKGNLMYNRISGQLG